MVICVWKMQTENAFAGERKDVLQCRWNLVNILMTGMVGWVPQQQEKRIRNARGCLSAASLDQWRLWAREELGLEQMSCHLLSSILFAVIHIFVEE